MLDPKRLCAERVNIVSVSDQDDVFIDLGFENVFFFTLSAVTDGRTEQVVVPLRSTATNIGTCSSDRPRLLALPPLLRGFRSILRPPLAAFENIGFIYLDNTH